MKDQKINDFIKKPMIYTLKAEIDFNEQDIKNLFEIYNYINADNSLITKTELISLEKIFLPIIAFKASQQNESKG